MADTGGLEMTVDAHDLQAVAEGVQITIGTPFNAGKICQCFPVFS